MCVCLRVSVCVKECDHERSYSFFITIIFMNVGGGVRLIKTAKLYMCAQNTTNTTRTDARRRVCAAMVPYC